MSVKLVFGLVFRNVSVNDNHSTSKKDDRVVQNEAENKIILKRAVVFSVCSHFDCCANGQMLRMGYS